MGEKLDTRLWQKFHPLFGPNLKVGFETTFSKNAALDMMLYERAGLIYRARGETVRVYEPACKIVGSCVDGDAAQVFFKPVSQAGSLYRRLVFARKIGDDGRPCRWMLAARYPSAHHAEIATFGFDSWNSKDPRYLSLAYPGLNPDGQFVPVYFKIQNGKEGEKSFIYLEMWCLDDEVQVLVVARKIDEEGTPEHLRSAKPEI